MHAIAEPLPRSLAANAPLDTTLSYPAWTREAIECLREHWPATDARQLEAIAIELFSDPESGVLPPRDAVRHWMRHLAPGPAPDIAAAP